VGSFAGSESSSKPILGQGPHVLPSRHADTTSHASHPSPSENTSLCCTVPAVITWKRRVEFFRTAGKEDHVHARK